MRIKVRSNSVPETGGADRFIRWQIVAEQRGVSSYQAMMRAIARGELPIIERCGRLTGWWASTLAEHGVKGWQEAA